jgi:formamidopyrimidine-DNA glycosylase
MPELPEVETVVRELGRKLKGKIIAKVEVRLSKVVALGPGTLSPVRTHSPNVAAAFTQKLVGQKILSVKRRAKLLIFDFAGPLCMLVHLKMTGQFVYLKRSELNKKIRIINKAEAPLHALPCPYTHVIFTFRDSSKLFYNDVRQFGYLKLVSDKELPHVKELAEFGPEPLDKKFTLSVFQVILKRRPKAKIKQLLIDPKLIAGIGNIYSDEILFRVKLRPTRAVISLSRSEISTLFAAIPFILKKGIASHGSSVGDFVRTDGSWGSMGKHHFVYGRAGEKCKVCGSMIKSTKFGGRTSSFCPKCQI